MSTFIIAYTGYRVIMGGEDFAYFSNAVLRNADHFVIPHFLIL